MKRKVINILLTLILSFSTFAQTDKDMEQQIEKLLEQLTLEEKVALCHAQSKFSSAGVPRLGIPELWMSDGPHGVRGEINWDNWGYADWTNDYVTAFPALTCLAATFNPDLSYAYGVAIGEEARYRKKDVLLGPGVNIYRTPLNGRNFEYLGEDPHLASVMVVPYIEGVQEQGVAACLKHYALNNQEESRGHINVNVSDRALREIYLPAFESAVKEAKVWSIMGAYNQYNAQHCCHNEKLNQILKDEWGFDGTLITDWGGAHDTKEAALHGLDIEMGSWTNGLTSSIDLAYDNYYLADPYLELLRTGELSEETVNDKVRRVLRMMFRTTMDKNRDFGCLNTKEHTDVARRIAVDGMVLLKNEAQFFPLIDKKGFTIAVIGENAMHEMTVGGGSSELKAKYEISPLEGIKARFTQSEIKYARGYASGPSAYGQELSYGLNADSLKQEALLIAEQSDVVIFIGGLNKNHYQDCEGADRKQYNLPFGQGKLIESLAKVNTNIGVVLVSGNAVEMSWLPQVKGLMQAWYNGSEAGNALADVLSGDVNPSGKLPFSYPVKLTDNAAHYFGELSYPGDSVNQYYKEDILVGYRWFDTKNIKPQFAFGYGLSYTDFEIQDMSLDDTKVQLTDTIRLTCTIRNVGAIKGAEVLQVYVGKQRSEVARATKELKAFQKVYLNPGERQTVSIEIPIKNLSYYDERTKSWQVEHGVYQLFLGTASNQIRYNEKVFLN
ncbi:MAG: glycoside hydrolase family 3 C-terminal domain-containing protein [Mangrovibacterium sp.]